MSAPNRNLLWANIVVDELARSGLRAACIAPGSRSTPLTIAFADHPDIAVYRHLDERSAGFFALGLARAAGKPVALVCTSGSAVANFFPAVVEAHESRLPLLILTGDRPPELRNSGANQTIDQPNFYAGYALWSVDLALPEGDPQPLTLRYLRTTAARAFATAAGSPKGVVHLNFPFRKPLEPIPVPSDHTDFPLPVSAGDVETRPPFTSVIRGSLQPTADQIDTLAPLLANAERGIIVCGTNCPSGGFASAVAALAAHLHYPVFAEPSSGLRFGDIVNPDLTIGAYETFLNNMNLPMPDLVIRFGDVPTSKWLNDWLAAADLRAYIQVTSDGVWSDDLHRTTHFLHCDPAALAESLVACLPPRPSNAWNEALQTVEAAAWLAVRDVFAAQTFDAAYVHDLIALLPAAAHLFVGSSLPIRHVDQFGAPRTAPLYLYANRGASGIDGNISTGLGIAAAFPSQPVFILVGDITLYHDMNGLFALKDQGMNNVTIILMNNDGGGIFHRLPINDFEPTFTDLFVMPHGLDFAHVAALYDLDYYSIADRAEFRAIAPQSGGGRARLIEVRTSTPNDESARRALVAHVRSQIRVSNL